MRPQTLVVALVEVLTGDRPRVREAVEIVLTCRQLGRLARCAELAEPSRNGSLRLIGVHVSTGPESAYLQIVLNGDVDLSTWLNSTYSCPRI